MTETYTAAESARLLERVRKLLAKAEDPGTTTPEAEALTGKAAELMAKYGIDRALLAADEEVPDERGSRVVTMDPPHADVQVLLFCGLGKEMRCEPVRLGRSKVHLFGFESDLERADMLYTSVFQQMATAFGKVMPPPYTRSPRAWNRSWLLGYATGVIRKVRAAEQAAGRSTQTSARGMSVELVLFDRSVLVKADLRDAYPETRMSRTTYSGSGYGAGYAEDQKADIGNASRIGGGRRQVR